MKNPLASIALLGLLALAIACDGAASARPDESGSNEMFSRDKNTKTENSLHPQLDAGLTELDAFPELSLKGTRGDWFAKKFRVVGEPPAATLEDDPQVDVNSAGYLFTGRDDDSSFLLRNTDEFSVELWKMRSSNDDTIGEQLTLGEIDPDQESWAGHAVVGVHGLPANRLLVALEYQDPRSKFALYVLEIGSWNWTRIAQIEPDTRNLDQFFSAKSFGDDVTVAIYFSDRTREAAEFYHNYYHHILVFTADHPNGTEVLELGIDTGNVTEWSLADNVLYLQTLDSRGKNEPRTGLWSLDLSNVLP